MLPILKLKLQSINLRPEVQKLRDLPPNLDFKILDDNHSGYPGGHTEHEHTGR